MKATRLLLDNETIGTGFLGWNLFYPELFVGDMVSSKVTLHYITDVSIMNLILNGTIGGIANGQLDGIDSSITVPGSEEGYLYFDIPLVEKINLSVQSAEGTLTLDITINI